MLNQAHEHIVRELGESSRTDTIFVLTAIVFNLIVLAVNSGLASEAVTRGRFRDVRHRVGGVHRDDGAAECGGVGGFGLGSADASDAARRAGGDVSG